MRRTCNVSLHLLCTNFKLKDVYGPRAAPAVGARGFGPSPGMELATDQYGNYATWKEVSGTHENRLSLECLESKSN